MSLLQPHLGEFQVMEPILPTGMGELSVGGEVPGLLSEYSGEEGDDEGDSVWVESEFSMGMVWLHVGMGRKFLWRCFH